MMPGSECSPLQPDQSHYMPDMVGLVSTGLAIALLIGVTYMGIIRAVSRNHVPS